MLFDHNMLMILLNLGLILAFTWLGFNLIKSVIPSEMLNAGQSDHLIISRELLSAPGFYKRYLIIKRMIKTDSEDDITPYYSSFFTC
ncbi:MAG: hypothetical protein AAGU27_16625 [Dehalobacterium sp.]